MNAFRVNWLSYRTSINAVAYFILSIGFLAVVSRSVSTLALMDELSKPRNNATRDYFLDPSTAVFNGGAFLCSSDGRSPIENNSVAEVGLPLISNILTKILHRQLTSETATWVNAAINLVGLLVLCFTLWISTYRLPSSLILLFGAFLLPERWLCADYYCCLFGAFCCFLSAVLWLSANWFKRQSFIKTIGPAFLLLAFTILIREIYGIFGMLCVVLLVTIAFKKAFQQRDWALAFRSIFLALPFALLPKVTSLLFFFRHWKWGIPYGQGAGRHGVFGIMLRGLGTPTTPNMWGITRTDETYVAIIKNVDPSVVYNSPEEFKIAEKLIREMVAQNPLEVARIYWKTAIATFTSEEFHLAPLRYLIIIISIILVANFWRLRNRFAFSDQTILGILILTCVLSFTQGILSHPWYVVPSEIAFVLTVVFLLDLLRRAYRA